MARLIVKSPYIKCGAGQSAGGYLKYIATRERVEIIPDGRPPTRTSRSSSSQKLVKDFPDAKELLEYEDYRLTPDKSNCVRAHHTGAGIELGSGTGHGRLRQVHRPAAQSGAAG